MKSDLSRDSLTQLPTVAGTIDSLRKKIQGRGELVVLYFNFDRYAKIEDIYGWEKLDALLETTANAMREFLPGSQLKLSELMVANPHDDDFVFFHIPEMDVSAATEQDITELTLRLQDHISMRVREEHGESIAALVETYVGRSHVYYNPKVRLERQIYRAMREAASASKSIEARELSVKLSDLRETLRSRSIYIDYHPIISADTGKVFGYEALARGIMRSMRSPEVMFDVASQSDLIWELSRLCRSRAVEGIKDHLKEGQLLFMNVDPHDFADPEFTEEELGVADPSGVVIEITERTAIKDYPKFRERLKAFRELGYRFAVDDAGSGYAGLGSIANLEPDFIKLDISLINCIDANFIKQNLVETMVRFANDQGAQVIAEGVERAEEFEVVKKLGVHLIQGFFLHRPGDHGMAPIVPIGGLPKRTKVASPS
jgi:EAL domain-containing protein (putative c-di-GMP-specific phosphodiesterase class I)/GGDEF domain-containing protein